MAFQDYFRGKQVFLTGHTGFKGSWLAEWLLGLGAEVHGYALDPKPHECLFDQLCLSSRLVSDTRADLADRKTLNDASTRLVQTSSYTLPPNHWCVYPMKYRLRLSQPISWELRMSWMPRGVRSTIHVPWSV
jgi:hypothetical protein